MTNSDAVSPTKEEKLRLDAAGFSIYIGLGGGCLSGLGINYLARKHIIDNSRYEQSKGSADDVEKAHQIYREIGKELGACTSYGTPSEYCSYSNAFIDKTPEQALQKLGGIEGIFSRNREFLMQSEYFPEAERQLHQVTTYIENNFRGDWPRNAHNWYAWLYSGGGRGGDRFHHVVLGQELRTFLAVAEDSKHELTYLTEYANTSDANTIASFVIGGILSGVIIGMVSCSMLKKIMRSIRLKPRVDF